MSAFKEGPEAVAGAFAEAVVEVNNVAALGVQVLPRRSQS